MQTQGPYSIAEQLEKAVLFKYGSVICQEYDRSKKRKNKMRIMLLSLLPSVVHASAQPLGFVYNVVNVHCGPVSKVRLYTHF